MPQHGQINQCEEVLEESGEECFELAEDEVGCGECEVFLRDDP